MTGLVGRTVTTSAGRLARPALVAVLAAIFAFAVALVAAGPGLAAGTGGIEVTPVPAQQDGQAVTTFRVQVPRDGATEVPYLLRNVEDGPRSARIYSARVLSSDGNFSLDEPDSSPYVSMPDREVTLEEGEVREESFRVTPGPDGPPDGEAYAAVVVEVRNGAVVQRANTLIYLSPGRTLPLPLLLVLLAVLLLLAVATAVALTARRARRGAATQGGPTPQEHSSERAIPAAP